MSKAGGERAETGELLPLPEGCLHGAQASDRRADDRQRDIGPGVEQAAYRVDRDAEHLGLGDGAHRREPSAALQGRDLALQRSWADLGEGDLAVAGLLGDLELALEHHVQGVGDVPFLDQDVTVCQVDDLAGRDQLLELLVVEAPEKRGVPQPLRDVGEREVLMGHRSAR